MVLYRSQTRDCILCLCYFYRVALPTRVQKFTVLKSPHIFKKHRVQYEIKTHSRLMQVKYVDISPNNLYSYKLTMCPWHR